MFYGNTYKNLETAQRLIYHYDLFNQIVRLKKAIRKRTFFFLMPALYVMCEETANYLEYNFFHKLVSIIWLTRV
jgi:hypothetical protein